MQRHPQRGDVVWVDFGRPGGSESQGRRPALIIQNDVGNRLSSTTIVASIPRTLKPFPVNVILEPHESGLPERSMVDCASIRSVSKTRILRTAGTLGAGVMSTVDRALKISLGLS